jgi:hypothetical protein
LQTELGKISSRSGARSHDNKDWKLVLSWLVLFLSAPLSAFAQSYTIDWFTIAGGGGTSTGGVYAVSGSIGQPDAGRLSGGSFTVEGGFWSGMPVPAPAPRLTVKLTGANTIVISWPSPSTGWNLQQNLNLTTMNWVAPSQAVADDVTLAQPGRSGRGACFRLFLKDSS